MDNEEVIILLVPQKTLKDVEGCACEGMTYFGFSPKQIRIAKHLSRSRKWQTFFHELLHLIEEDEGIELSEENIDKIATGIYKTFMRNGWELPGS